MTLRHFLGVIKRIGLVDESITSVEVENQVSAGIKWRSLGPDMVPIFEEHSARLERGYTLTAWYALEPMERAIVIAQRRLENASKNLHNDAQTAHAKKNAGKNSRKR